MLKRRYLAIVRFYCAVGESFQGVLLVSVRELVPEYADDDSEIRDGESVLFEVSVAATACEEGSLSDALGCLVRRDDVGELLDGFFGLSRLLQSSYLLEYHFEVVLCSSFVE